MKRSLLLATLPLAILLAPAGAHAATILDFPTCVGRCDTGTVMVLTLDGGAVNASMPAHVFSDGAVGFNIAGPEEGLMIAITSPGYTLGATDDVIGPFGSFEYTIDGPPSISFPIGGRELTFTITRDAGFLSLLDLFEMNEMGWWAAAHTDYQFPGEDFRAAVGFRPEQPQPVPEPATMLLLGTGLVAAWRARRA